MSLTNLTNMDLLFLVILALLFVRAIRSIVAGQRVELPAGMPGRIIADILLLALFCGAVFLRWASISAPLIMIAGAAGYVLLSSFAKSGLGKEGLIQNGKTVPYASMRVFRVERESEKEVVVRIATTGKEYGVSFPAADKERFLARMAAAGVRFAEDAADFNPYTGEDI